MLKRLPEIVELKKLGIVGENKDGFLQFRVVDKTQQPVVDAENADRKLVYQSIADKQGTTAEFVGRRRATQLAAKAKRGDWIQKPSGDWIKK